MSSYQSTHSHYGVPCTVWDCKAPSRVLCAPCKRGEHTWHDNTGACAACECAVTTTLSKHRAAREP